MQPTRWDSEGKFWGKRLSKREKLALLQSYETLMWQGQNREDILVKLATNVGVGQRQIERILAQAKEYKRGIKKHYTDLSVTASKLASNLERYLGNLERYVDYSGTDFDSTIGDVVYGGWLPDIDEINEMNRLADLFSLKTYKVNKSVAVERTDIKNWVKVPDKWLNHGYEPERSVKMYEVDKFVALNLLCHLKGKFPELANITDWVDLTCDKITMDLIDRLKLTVYQAHFPGNCPSCPR